MKNIFIYWTRWIFLIPVSILVAVLVDFPIHWLLYISLSSGPDPFINPYPELPEQIIAPFFRAFAFIITGSIIAPSYKVQTGVVLFILWAAGLVFNIYFLNHIEDFDIPRNIKINWVAGGLPIITGAIGAILAVFSLWNESRNKDSKE